MLNFCATPLYIKQKMFIFSRCTNDIITKFWYSFWLLTWKNPSGVSIPGSSHLWLGIALWVPMNPWVSRTSDSKPVDFWNLVTRFSFSFRNDRKLSYFEIWWKRLRSGCCQRCYERFFNSERISSNNTSKNWWQDSKLHQFKSRF